MKNNDFVYSDILDKLGWFEPKAADYRIDKNYKEIHIVSGCSNPIDKNTLIAYYPGSFGTFHEGHISAVKQTISHLKKFSENYIVVISPANSDYAIDKYGKNSVHSRNDYRFNKICQSLSGIEGNVAIDLSPMLNSVCDTNFPLLVKDFVESQISAPITELKNKPIVVLGKDRKDFQLIKLIVDDLDFFYVEDSTGQSTSKIIREEGNAQYNKKKVILRYNKIQELDLFERFYGDLYEEIIPSPIEEELKIVSFQLKFNCIDFTICKDYAGFNGVQYHRLSRDFAHALDTPKKFIHDKNLDFKGKRILDSDVYSGETKRYIENLGGQLFALYNFEGQENEWEIVDFDDFKNPKFCYPYKDIATRCSMPAFSFEDHVKYQEFLKKVNSLC